MSDFKSIGSLVVHLTDKEITDLVSNVSNNYNSM